MSAKKKPVKENMATKQASQKQSAGNPIGRGISFYKDSIVEIKKVHYPTKDEVIRMTIVVMIALVLFSVFLGIADHFLAQIMGSILT